MHVHFTGTLQAGSALTSIVGNGDRFIGGWYCRVQHYNRTGDSDSFKFVCSSYIIERDVVSTFGNRNVSTGKHSYASMDRRSASIHIPRIIGSDLSLHRVKL